MNLTQKANAGRSSAFQGPKSRSPGIGARGDGAAPINLLQEPAGLQR